MRLEEVLQALREGRKIRAKGWRSGCYIVRHNGGFVDERNHSFVFESLGQLDADWEIVPAPVPMADYLVSTEVLIDGCSVINLWYQRQTHPIGKQPKGSVLVPGTERDEYSVPVQERE